MRIVHSDSNLTFTTLVVGLLYYPKVTEDSISWKRPLPKESERRPSLLSLKTASESTQVRGEGTPHIEREFAHSCVSDLQLGNRRPGFQQFRLGGGKRLRSGR